MACSDSGSDGDDDVGVTLTLGQTDDGIGDDGDDSSSEDETTAGCPPGGCLDFEDPTTTTGSGACASGDGECNKIDLLFVIDNSGTMGEEQINLSANFPLLIDKLEELEDAEGNPLVPDVNIMVTTTDLGHPECTFFEPPGYDPAQGSPVNTACSNRISDFTGLGDNPPAFPEACTNGCPVAVEPNGNFIHFEGDDTNVPGDDISGALSCIGPQGISGCGYEAPLEAMLQAINPGAQWNQGTGAFLRDGAVLAVAIVTDEADCSVRSPDGYAFFTDSNFDDYWEVNPGTMTPQSTSAVCWNAGVECGMPDVDGVYSDCTSVDNGVLHPLDRYLDYLQGDLISGQKKEVIMLGILGVPLVTEHNMDVPFEPIAGGVEDLVYRQWKDGAYPMVGDILPGDSGTAETKEFEFGVGPGCTGDDGMGNFTGQAIPPVRIKEVCEALNTEDRVRCCIESVCDTDFSDAIGCLTGAIQQSFIPIG